MPLSISSRQSRSMKSARTRSSTRISRTPITQISVDETRSVTVNSFFCLSLSLLDTNNDSGLVFGIQLTRSLRAGAKENPWCNFVSCINGGSDRQFIPSRSFQRILQTPMISFSRFFSLHGDQEQIGQLKSHRLHRRGYIRMTCCACRPFAWMTPL